MRRISLASATIGPVPAVDLISATGEAGFDAVGLRFESRPELPSPWPPGPIPVDEMKRRLAFYGLRVLHIEAFHLRPQTDCGDFAMRFDVAAELGSENVLVSINDESLPRAQDKFGRFCEMAVECNMRVALEFKDDSVLRTLADTVSFLRQVGRSNAGICLDTYHFSRSRGQPADLLQIDRGLLRFVQFSDAPARLPSASEIRNESRTGRLYPGQGGLWLAELLASLPGDVPLDLEASGAFDPALSSIENAKIAGAVTRRFLAEHDPAA